MLTVKNPSRTPLLLLLSLLMVLYLVLVGWNIAYPLLWADESMTAMHGRRVLQYGYPKVHDGRNVLYDLENVDLPLGVDPVTDAYIGGPGWVQYYFAAPFVAAAEKVPGPYGKTALIRGAFALAGTGGLLLYLLAALPVIPSLTVRIAAGCYYVFACCCSVPLLLHIREARYYSLTFLIFGGILFLYSRSRLSGASHRKLPAIMLGLLLILLFLTFAPAFYITVSAMLAYELLAVVSTPLPEGTSRFDRRRVLEMIHHSAPMLAAVVITLPLAVYFRTFQISSAIAATNNYSLMTYLANLKTVAGFYLFRDKLAIVVVLQVAVAVSRRMQKVAVNDDSAIDRLSRLCLLLLVCYLLFIPAISSFYLFDRYFIYLQPLLTLMVIVDMTRLWGVQPWQKKAVTKGIVAVGVVTSLAITIISDRQLIVGKLQETVTQYRGTLDFLIPVIAGNVADPSKLTIATNYEETSYTYYLNSRTTIGFVGNNLAEDLRQTPDIIILRRKNFSYISDPAALLEQLTRTASYRAFSLPVYDAPYNTIPQTDQQFPHPFTTAVPQTEEDRVILYLRNVPALNSLASALELMASQPATSP